MRNASSRSQKPMFLCLSAVLAILILVVGFLIMVLGPANLVSAETLERSTEIEIREDGSALWIIENAIPPETTDDEVQQTISQFESYIRTKIDELGVLAERSMEIKDFYADGPLQVHDHRVIRYEFGWENFAEVEGKYIRIGDVFEAGAVNLSSTSDVLVIRYPASYAPREVVPSPDETLDCGFAWSGPKSFSFGEPRITLKSVSSRLLTIAVAVAVGCALVAAWYIWFKKVFNPLLKASKKRKLGGS